MDGAVLGHRHLVGVHLGPVADLEFMDEILARLGDFRGKLARRVCQVIPHDLPELVLHGDADALQPRAGRKLPDGAVDEELRHGARRGPVLVVLDQDGVDDAGSLVPHRTFRGAGKVDSARGVDGDSVGPVLGRRAELAGEELPALRREAGQEDVGGAQIRLPVETRAAGVTGDSGQVDIVLGIDGNPVGDIIGCRSVLVGPELAEVCGVFDDDDVLIARPGVPVEGP